MLRKSAALIAKLFKLKRQSFIVAQISIVGYELLVFGIDYLVYYDGVVFCIAVNTLAAVITNLGRVKVAHIAFAAIDAVAIVQYAFLFRIHTTIHNKFAPHESANYHCNS